MASVSRLRADRLLCSWQSGPAWAGCLMISLPGRPLSTITCDVTPARPEIQTLGQRHTEKKYRGAREKIRRVYPSYWIFIPNRIPSFLPEQGFGSCILSKYLARPVKLNEAEKVRRSLCRVSCMWFGVESFQETLIIPLTDMSLYPARSKARWKMYILVIYNIELFFQLLITAVEHFLWWNVQGWI